MSRLDNPNKINFESIKDRYFYIEEGKMGGKVILLTWICYPLSVGCSDPAKKSISVYVSMDDYGEIEKSRLFNTLEEADAHLETLK